MGGVVPDFALTRRFAGHIIGANCALWFPPQLRCIALALSFYEDEPPGPLKLHSRMTHMIYRSSRIFGILHLVVLSVAFLAGCFALTTLTQSVAMAQVPHSKTASVGLNLSENVQSTAWADSDTFQFLPAVNYLSGAGGSHSLVVADLNGDGFPDAIVVNGGSNFTIFMGRGDGVFPKSTTYSFDTGAFGAIVGADLNGDHKVDLVISSGNSVVVMLGNGDGTFQAPATFDTGNDAHGLAVADVNLDGIPDIVTASSSTGTVSVLLGNGGGTFQAPRIYPTNASSLRLVEVADFNGDGKPDLVISSYGEPIGGGIMLGNGDGTFQAPIGLLQTSGVAVGDINGDGKMDLVVGGEGFTLEVLLGNGDGTFSSVITNISEVTPVELADVNNDGKLDVLFTAVDGNEAGILLGNGDGTLQPATWLNTKRYSQGQLAVADVDGNGKPDVLVTDETITRLTNLKGGWLTVFLNNSGSPSSTVVATSLSPSHIHQSVTFTATVSANGVPAPDGDLVRFYKKGSLLGSAPLKGGIARFTTSNLNKGTLEIKATYIGDPSLQDSSSTVTQVVE